MKRKKWFITLAIVIAVLLMIDVVAGNYFYKLAIERGPKELLQDNQDLEVSSDTMDKFLEGDWISWTEDQPFETIEMTSFDGLDLQGYYLPQDEPTNKTVIFAHGYLGRASDIGIVGEYYYDEQDDNMFTHDLGGPVNSEVEYYVFVWDDRLNMVALF